MDPEIVTAALPAVTKVGTSYMSHRKEIKRMEKKAELDKEIIEERTKRAPEINRPARRPETRETEVERRQETRSETVIRGTSFESHLETIKRGPQCDYCQELLSMLVDEDPERRRQGVREVAELKELMMQNPTEEEMREQMRDFEVLPELTMEM